MVRPREPHDGSEGLPHHGHGDASLVFQPACHVPTRLALVASGARWSHLIGKLPLARTHGGVRKQAPVLNCPERATGGADLWPSGVQVERPVSLGA